LKVKYNEMKTRLKYILTIISLGFFQLGITQQTMLWKISGNDLKHPSYILGTIHFLCEQDKLDHETSLAVGKTKKVFLEIDMDDPSLMSKMQKLMLDPSVKEKFSELDEMDYVRLDSFLKEKYGASLDQMSIMKPFAIMSMILMKNLECEQFTSMEDLVMKSAKAYRMGVYGLETVEFQMGLFDQVPFEDQMEWIWDALESDFGNEYKNMLEAYNEGDLDALYDLILESPGIENYMDLLLIDRNINWIPIMKSEMEKQPTFFAVGAGHLAGNMGVLELLEEEGYDVEKVISE